MKKFLWVFLVVIAIVICFVSIVFVSNGRSQINDQSEISKLVTNSNLEILLNLEDFNSDSFIEKNLLEVAMLFAENNGYLNESTDNGMYLQYINMSELHDIIFELTNIVIEAPIQIEDFQYRYDSENEYYYCVPINISRYEIKNINNVYKNDNIYSFDCTAIKLEDGEIVDQKSFITELKYEENVSYTNYQVIKQKIY